MAGNNNTPRRHEPDEELPAILDYKSSPPAPPRSSSSSPQHNSHNSQDIDFSPTQLIRPSQAHSNSSQDIKTSSIARHCSHSSSPDLQETRHISQQDPVSLAPPTHSSSQDSSSTEDASTTYQTVATVPVPQLLQTQFPTQVKSSQLQSSNALPHTTQPTQLLARSPAPRLQSKLHHTANSTTHHITQTTLSYPLHTARDTPPPALHITRNTPSPALQTTQDTQLRTPPRATQVTQHHLLHSSQNTQRKPSIVQVAVSSPLRPPPKNTQPSQKSVSKGGILAQALAPAGTSFRPPLGIRKPPPSLPPVIDLSDDDQGPTYKGSSSEDELIFIRKNDIRPSIFARSSRDRNKNSIPESPARLGNRFKEITSKAYYKPSDNMNPEQNNSTGNMAAGVKRSSDALDSDVTSPERASKQLKQMSPSRPDPSEDVINREIADPVTRQKVIAIRRQAKGTTILKALATLNKYKGDFEKAMEEITGKPRPKKQPEMVDITKSDDESTTTNQPMAEQHAQPKTAKRELKAPTRSIHDKWSSTQTATTAAKRAAPEPTEQNEPARKKRLMRARQIIESDSEKEFTSGPDTDASPSSEEGSGQSEQQVLNFINTCSAKDLADLSNQTEAIANLIISRRPFKNLDQIRKVAERQPSPVATAAQGKRKPRAKKPIGEKVVDVSMDMWAGYEAVDDLVTRCEALGQPVADEMKKWGVDVFGAAQSGELELVSLEVGGGGAEPTGETTNGAAKRDSGIGASVTTTPEKENNTTEPEKNDTTTDQVKSTSDNEDDEDVVDGKKQTKKNFLGQPANLGEGVALKDYQLVGLNWLSLLYSKGLSCILADEMGLGKTCQVISFLGHLKETGVKGPHLVIVPGSTLENWLREFSVFCPSLKVEPYYASEKERGALRKDIMENRDNIDVVVTTYDVATRKHDNFFLAKLQPNVCVYDEGHALKNSGTIRYNQLMKISTKLRILMTGTPLQNNLKELVALLGFILPSVFNKRQGDLEYIFKARAKTTDTDHSSLLSTQRIARAKSMLTPFVLRRKKHQVLKHLPEKTCTIEYCEMTPGQHEAYHGDLQEAKDAIEARAAGQKPKKETGNVLMRLRKSAIHPILGRRFFDDKKIKKMAKDLMKEPSMKNNNTAEDIHADMEVSSDFELQKICKKYPDTLGKYAMEDDAIMDSGKAAKLAELLTTFRSNGDRVLVFSQFTSVLDLAEAILDQLEMQYFRLDGSTPMAERQDMIDQFSEEREVVAFLLSTKAGGQGINLTAANKVVIIDQSFNPQEDIQAENRAHRVGQTRSVEVLRLVTRGTVEEQILALGVAKRVLDDRVAGEERGLARLEEEERGILAAIEAAVGGKEGDGSTE
ncbi:MAG: vacuolar ATPase assembly integral membrane protein vma21 [Watsoniomyces obsoletus]|nr:MAG: vacuolar ATPase assembly integral membrane protein vma21 [Watsoniomyces obsoletus]